MHLILDLDGTLIYTDEDDTLHQRPYLTEFLEAAFTLCDSVSIWSAAGEDYVKAIAKKILPSGRQWHSIRWSEHCYMRYTSYGDIIIQKRLAKIWRTTRAKREGITRHNTIIIEDTPGTCVKNYGNAVYVPRYYGSSGDDCLRKLLSYLQTVSKIDNVREVEKRDWYTTTRLS